ncbi:hypothetical protein CFIMG_008432RA00001 [Ceratocystis fimbriata CBS 114723]|uniref:Uncharacterized protein n=1 Tax=Ceratocystis fimbriata CBS 114723 TaxID=1035309 RepID=A0A2C5X2S0_9PEZI|nr:hypothetical protein CFIMG_008432RA00001 [Ceratocystis fimbriata CBS 114723]
MSPPTSTAAPLPPTSATKSPSHDHDQRNVPLTRTRTRAQAKALVSPPRSPLKDIQANQAPSTKFIGSSSEASPKKPGVDAIRASVDSLTKAKAPRLPPPCETSKPQASPRKKPGQAIGAGSNGISTPKPKLKVYSNERLFFSPKLPQDSSPVMRGALMTRTLREELLGSIGEERTAEIEGKEAIDVSSHLRSPVINTYGMGKQSLRDRPLRKPIVQSTFITSTRADLNEEELWDVPSSPVKVQRHIELDATSTPPTLPPKAPFAEMGDSVSLDRKSPKVSPTRRGGLGVGVKQGKKPLGPICKPNREGNLTILISSDEQSAFEESHIDGDSDGEFIQRTREKMPSPAKGRVVTRAQKGNTAPVRELIETNQAKELSEQISPPSNLPQTTKEGISKMKSPAKVAKTKPIEYRKQRQRDNPPQAQEPRHSDVSVDLKAIQAATGEIFNLINSKAESKHGSKPTSIKAAEPTKKSRSKKSAADSNISSIEESMKLLTQFLDGTEKTQETKNTSKRKSKARKASTPGGRPAKKQKTEAGSKKPKATSLSSLMATKIQSAQLKQLEQLKLESQESLVESEMSIGHENKALISKLKNESQKLVCQVQNVYESIIMQMNGLDDSFDAGAPGAQKAGKDIAHIVSHAQSVSTIYNDVKEEFEKYHLKVPIERWNKDWDEVDEIISLGEQLGQKILQAHISAELEPGRAYCQLMDSLNEKEKAIVPLLFSESLKELQTKSWGQAVWGLWDALESVAEVIA